MTKEEFERKVKEMALQHEGSEDSLTICIDMTIREGVFRQSYFNIDNF